MSKTDQTTSAKKVLDSVPAGKPDLSASELLERMPKDVRAADAMGVLRDAVDDGTVVHDSRFRFYRTEESPAR